MCSVRKSTPDSAANPDNVIHTLNQPTKIKSESQTESESDQPFVPPNPIQTQPTLVNTLVKFLTTNTTPDNDSHSSTQKHIASRSRRPTTSNMIFFEGLESLADNFCSISFIELLPEERREIFTDNLQHQSQVNICYRQIQKFKNENFHEKFQKENIFYSRRVNIPMFPKYWKSPGYFLLFSMGWDGKSGLGHEKDGDIIPIFAKAHRHVGTFGLGKIPYGKSKN